MTPTAELRSLKVVGESARHWQISSSTHSDLSYAVPYVWTEIRSLPEAANVEIELEKLRSQGRAIGHFGGDLSSNYARPILAGYLKGAKDYGFVRDRFVAEYRRVEEYLTANKVRVRCYFELSQLQGAVSSIVLDDLHSLLQVDEELGKRIWQNPIASGFGFFNESFPVNFGSYVLQADFFLEKSKSGNLNVEQDREWKESALALRLSKSGTGQIGFKAYEVLGFHPLTARFGFNRTEPPISFKYQLDESAAVEIQQNWIEALALARKVLADDEAIPGHLKSCVRRFAQSFEKWRPEDFVIDHVFCLEAMFTKENDAISYRLPLRACVSLGETAPERQRIYEELRSAYKFRSAIAHGGHAKKNAKVDPAELAKQTEHIVQQSILRLNRSSKKDKDAFLNEVDAAIVEQRRPNLT